ncbi:membrane peptidoglycan carboxypeptidase [Homoserinimonas aerilata]|uniref:Membrane peptidoglycan carboxypeptidase n=1 Tax=Homoserinimonas aerilata TaxID=1162970 RepID=A0A542YKY0_9MICO|nr:transglycosylase domain-containing protein [Homoserinimonas aerilata]TQL48750.1 membrane peptidoglycan carboxypeptidase [Homoserinimonas aerilata]
MSAPTSKRSGAFGALAGFLGLSVLAGVLVTALVTPALAVTGMAAKGGVDVFNSLPEFLELNQLSQRNTIFGLNGAGESVPIAQIYDQNRQEVSSDEVSQFLKDALVAGEDRRFYEHGGVDMASIIRAGIGNIIGGGIESGASTLTMQLVKNIKIQAALNEPTKALRDAKYAEAQEQSIQRKLQEAKLAIGLEKKYTKDEILLAYLNIAGFGGNTYGVQAAAQEYFSVSAKDLTLAQAASLIATVQTPSYMSLNSEENFERNKSRRDNVVLKNMFELGYIDKAQYDEAVATPITVAYSAPSNGCMYAATGPFFCDYITKLVPELTMLGSTAEERQANWKRGGYSVYTSLVVDQQNHAQAVLEQQAPNNESRMELGAAANVVEPGTGRIRVMAQNKTFNNSLDGGGAVATAVNFSTDVQYGGSTGFQPGSTYKIFTLATWLKSGHGLNEVVNGSRRIFQQSNFKVSCGDPFAGTYDPPNYGGGGGGTSTVLQATANSYNIAFIAMAEKLDQCEIRDTAESMGVHRADNGDLQYNPATILGTNEIAPLTMAAAVATIGAGGLYCKPTAIDKIVDASGTDLGGQKRECTQALSPEISSAVAYALKRVVTNGSGSASNPHDGIEVAGKTGTTDGAEDTWMIGATSTNGLAVWVGNINGKTNLNRIYFAGGRGDTARHRIFKPIIQALDGQFGGAPYADPPAQLLSGQGAIVPDVTGQSPEQAKSVIEGLGFEFSIAGEVSSRYPKGAVGGTDPGPGSTLPRGSTISVYTSLGNVVTMPDVTNKGYDFEEAKRQLGGSYTNVKKADEMTTDPSKVGTVISSNPAPGSDVAPENEVTLGVGKLADTDKGPGKDKAPGGNG